MRLQLFKYWDQVRSSFWFLPAVMAASAVVLSFAGVALDEQLADGVLRAEGWTFHGGADAASAVLGAVAGSMITLAGVVFSMTLVALSLASSQLGPRLLRNFMRDKATQTVLGTFLATFLYCLLVLRTIRHVEGDVFVPHVSVTLGVLFAVVSVGVLIYFIHHVSISIQANEIVARVGRELIDGLERLFPEQFGRGAPRSAAEPSAEALDLLERQAVPVAATEDGYLQLIDAEVLMALAVDEDLVIRIERRPGHYVVAGAVLVRVQAADGAMPDDLEARVNAAFVLGDQRSTGQDVEFSVDQLVEIAVRALSTGVNDPFTAIACVDRLGSALCRLTVRPAPSPYRRDDEDRLRVIAPVFTFPAMVDSAFDQIRQSAASTAAVSIRLLESITVIAGFSESPAHRAALLRQVDMILRGARTGLPEAEDRRTVEARARTAEVACRGPSRVRGIERNVRVPRDPVAPESSPT